MKFVHGGILFYLVPSALTVLFLFKQRNKVVVTCLTDYNGRRAFLVNNDLISVCSSYEVHGFIGGFSLKCWDNCH